MFQQLHLRSTLTGMPSNRNNAEVAVSLNNFAVRTLQTRCEGNVISANQVMKYAIGLIKTCLSNGTEDCLYNGRLNVSSLALSPSAYQDSFGTTSLPYTVEAVSNRSPCPAITHPESTRFRGNESLSTSSTAYRSVDNGTLCHAPSSVQDHNKSINGTTPILTQVPHARLRHGNWIVYPMTIDDNDEPTAPISESVLEYRATVMMYNLAIINLVSPMNMDGSQGTSQMVPPTLVEEQERVEQCFQIRVKAAFKIFHLALLQTRRFVQPYFQHLANSADEEMTDSTSHSSNCTPLRRPADDELYRKYIVLMILINYQLLDIVQMLQLPNEYYEYHRSTMNQLVSVLSYIELFVLPVTSTSATYDGRNPGQYTSPAA